jgi:hypothetical protein
MKEVKIFILNNKIDIMLILEIHFTEIYYFKILYYSIYHATHPDGTYNHYHQK